MKTRILPLTIFLLICLLFACNPENAIPVEERIAGTWTFDLVKDCRKNKCLDLSIPYSTDTLIFEEDGTYEWYFDKGKFTGIWEHQYIDITIDGETESEGVLILSEFPGPGRPAQIRIWENVGNRKGKMKATEELEENRYFRYELLRQ